jgi:hypothetical protein
MKTKIILLAIASAMALPSCKSTVADHVPAACGTETGNIRVDALTSVSTLSRIAPVGAECAQKRTSHPCEAPGRRFATTSEGILVSTHRMSGIEGFHHGASGVGDVLGGGGNAAFGAAALGGKLRSNIRNTQNLRFGGCTDPNSPYIYGY